MFCAETQNFIKKNKAILFFLFLWTYRLFFLMQRNDAGSMINKFVLLQIFAELSLFGILLSQGFNFMDALTSKPIAVFSLLYAFGMASFFWGVRPFMGTYFAFENIIMLSVLYYLAVQTKNLQELERYYVTGNLVILWMFLIRCVFFGGGLHSVAYSTVAGLVLVYCVAEYDTLHRSKEELKILFRGAFWGGLVLILSTSSGAMVSVCAAILILAFFAQNGFVKFSAFVFLIVLLVSYFTGVMEWVYSLLFPGKSMVAITHFHGRDTIWNMIFELWHQRPWFGWGYATVERILPLYCIDAHNSIIGVLGSLGYVGCGILILAMLKAFFFALSYVKIPGFRGVLAALVCGFVNSNTSNFLACQETLQAVSFQMILVFAAVRFMQYYKQGAYYEKPLLPKCKIAEKGLLNEKNLEL